MGPDMGWFHLATHKWGSRCKLIVSCHLLGEGGTGAACVVCTTAGGEEVGRFDVPPGNEPFGAWLLEQVTQDAAACSRGDLCLVDSSGGIIGNGVLKYAPLHDDVIPGRR